MRPPPTALTIAGSDPSGGAGLQADLRVFAAHGLFGSAVVAATTVQSATRGVVRTRSLGPDELRDQLEAALVDRPVGAAKTGMLGSADNVRVVASTLRGRDIPLVVDPVLVSSSGAALLGPGGVEALRELLPLATVITPNLPETARLLGRELPPAEAARALAGLGPAVVVVTGGHGDPTGPCVDHVYLREADRSLQLRAPRLATGHDHGTGCLFAAGVVCSLILDGDLERSVRYGHACVQQGLRGGQRLSAGSVWLDRIPGQPPGSSSRDPA